MLLRASVRSCTSSCGRALAAFALLLAAPLTASAATIVVPPGGDLQRAIDEARPGDTIELQPGGTYVGNFTLPVKPGAAEIVIRTAPDPRLPGPGRRIDPVAHAALLAKIRSGNPLPAVQTDAATHHWRLLLLELQATAGGFGEIVRLGRGGADQVTLDSVPYDITIERCYIHGDPYVGQKRGISLNSASTTIRDSYISDMKGVGLDTQAIAGWNGPGPYVIENNYLEGAGENVLIGGADPYIPGLVPSDITLRGNWLFKPRSWQAPIIPTPSASSSALAGAGSLPPGTYAYRVVARGDVGQNTIGNSLPSAPVSAVLNDTGAVSVSWPAVSHAKEYRVYGRAPGGQTMYWTVAETSFVDTGGAGTTATVPTDGTRWTVKNIFELKNARRVLAEGNILENNWQNGQTGVAIAFTPRNQDGHAPWSNVADVTFRYNILRHAGGGININGYDSNYPSQQTVNVLVEHNLFYDINTSDGPGRFMQIGSGPANVTVDHNTIIQAGTLLYVYGKHPDGTYDVVQGFRFANNLANHSTYGIMGEGGGSLGTSSILTYFLDATRVVANVFAGGPALRYPAGNFFPDVASFNAGFADDNYSLRDDSPYKQASTDQRDLGADIDRLLEMTGSAISGNASQNENPTAAPGGPYVAPTLSVVVFDGGGSADQDGTIVSYVWSWPDGCPDTSGAVVMHEFTQPGTFNVTLTVTDDQGAVSNAMATLTVLNRLPSVDGGGPYAAQAGTAVLIGASAADADGQVIAYRWNWGDGSPEASGTTPVASHVYSAAGTYQARVTVTDNIGASQSDSASVQVAAIPPSQPGPGSAPDIVISAAELPASALHGNWFREADASATAGAKLSTPDVDLMVLNAPLAAPQHYFDVTFDARANTSYRLWLRMAATRNSKLNDAVWVQFSDAVNASGVPLYPIGTTSGLLVNLATDATGSSISAWGWQNTSYWLKQPCIVRFAHDGTHTLRVQVREDGAQIDQIVLSASTYLNAAPGPVSNDTHAVSKPLTDIVVYGVEVTAPGAWWQRAADATGAGGVRLLSPDAGWSSNTAPVAEPVRYFDVTVQAQANLDYRLWLRLKAANDSKYNDAVWVQFSDAVAGGRPRYQIGSSDGLLVNLATTATASSLGGWGWGNSAYWIPESDQPTIVRFDTCGAHTIRIQVREDGVSVDQIVLSPSRFLNASPGGPTADATIVPKP